MYSSGVTGNHCSRQGQAACVWSVSTATADGQAVQEGTKGGQPTYRLAAGGIRQPRLDLGERDEG